MGSKKTFFFLCFTQLTTSTTITTNKMEIVQESPLNVHNIVPNNQNINLFLKKKINQVNS